MEEAGDLLAGLRVLDTANYIAGPSAAAVLADFGADVIKIEAPRGGDPYRQFQGYPGNPPSAYDYGWQVDNRNKRGLALDLRTPEGQAVLARLAAGSDVVMVNAPLKSRARLGLEYETLSKHNPKLIYASFTAYGEEGPDADRIGFDHTACWARSGLMDTIKPSPDSAPARTATGMGDHVSGLTLVAGVMMALYRRERTGRGGTVMTNLMANGLWMNAVQAQAMLFGAEYAHRPPRERNDNALHNLYRSSDGRWFHLIAVPEDKSWPALVTLLESDAVRDDPRFASTEARRRNSADLIAVLDKAFSECPLDHWAERFDAAGINYGPVARLRDIPEDRQMRETGAIAPICGLGDGLSIVDSPVWLGGAEKKAHGRAPRLGEHSAAILREFGFDETEIDALHASGTIAMAEEGRTL